MNSVPGQTREKVIEEDAVLDRRRGMKLIPCESLGVRSRLRIDVEDALLRPNREKKASRRKDLPVNLEFPVHEVAVMAAALVGLVIGFLVGRNHESE